MSLNLLGDGAGDRVGAGDRGVVGGDEERGAPPQRRILRQRLGLEHVERGAFQRAGIDMALLDADLKAHDADISALLKRDMSEAESLGLEVPPVFLIGPFKVAKAIDYDEFKATVADFRARIAK